MFRVFGQNRASGWESKHVVQAPLCGGSIILSQLLLHFCQLLNRCLGVLTEEGG